MVPSRVRRWHSGEPVEARYQLQNADVIVTLDADFLFTAIRGSRCMRPTGLHVAANGEQADEPHVRH